MPFRTRIILFCAIAALCNPLTASTAGTPNEVALDQKLRDEIAPLLKQYCLGCHSAEKHKGDLNLERFTSFKEVSAEAKIW